MASNSALEGQVHDFVDEVPEKFKCRICTNVLRDPRLTECCGQHFCQGCLQSWFQTQTRTLRSCPHCRTVNFVHIHDKSVQRELNQLCIRCSHHEEGCQWVGELGDLQTHLNSNSGCGYQVVECPNRCNSNAQSQGLRLHQGTHSVQKLRRKDLQEHTTSQCPLRRYKCAHCGLEDTHKTITGSHYSKCPMFPLPCPNACGETGIKRRDIPTHRQQCPMEKLQCPNKCVYICAGTALSHQSTITTVYRKDLEKHLKSECDQRVGTCPFCGKRVTYKNFIQQHRSVCPNAPLTCSNSCGATEIKRCDMPTHRQQCPLEPVQCPNKCPKGHLQRKDLKDHLTNECSLRKCKCQYCGCEHTYQNISTVHNATCPDLPLECPNKCGATKIKRRNVTTHRNKCPLESVQCPFQKAGCGAKLLRKDLDEHVTTETQQHLLLTFKKMCSLEEECSQLKKKNLQLEWRCQALETRNSELDKQRKKAQRNTADPYVPRHGYGQPLYTSTQDDWYDPYDS